MRFIRAILVICVSGTLLSSKAYAGKDTTLVLKKTIRGGLTPKSIVHNGHGIFFAQNMMYSHTISVFDEHYRLLKTISDRVQLEKFGIEDKKGNYRGSPVECAFTPDGKYAFVSNYYMEGEGFTRPGCDTCYGSDYDISYVYKVNTATLEIEQVLPTGSVPKYLAVSPNGKHLLVSNWSSGDVILYDLNTEKEVKKFKVGRFPRGIAIDSKSRYAYVAVMGGTSIWRIDLESNSHSRFAEVGKGPRHLCIDGKDSVLYVSVNNEGNIAAIDLQSGNIRKLFVGSAPRSMTLGKDDRFLYVVNYSAAQFSKIDLQTFRVSEKAETGKHPIGITFNERNNEVWVACYSGSVMIYKDIESGEGITAPLARWMGMEPVLNDLNEGWNNLFSRRPENSVPISGKAGSTPSTSPQGKENLPNPSTPDYKPESPIAVKENSSTVTGNSSSYGKYFVVTGSFKTPSNASRKTEELRKNGYSGKVVDSGKGTQYAAIGGFESREAASAEMERYKSGTGLEAWIWEQK